MVFTHDMADWLSFNIDEAWLAENISLKDFGTGVRLGKLKREEKLRSCSTKPSPTLRWTPSCLTAIPVASVTSSSKAKFGMKTAPTPRAPSSGWTRINPHAQDAGKTLILVLWPKASKPLEAVRFELRLRQQALLRLPHR